MFGAFGSEQTVRPLHRMTPLRDDPAWAWLSSGERLRIDALGWFLWVAFVVIAFVVRQIVHAAVFVFVTPIFSGRISLVIVGGLAAMMASGDPPLDPEGEERSNGEPPAATGQRGRGRRLGRAGERAQRHGGLGRRMGARSPASQQADRRRAGGRRGDPLPAPISRRLRVAARLRARRRGGSRDPHPGRPRGACSERPTSLSTATSSVIFMRTSASPPARPIPAGKFTASAAAIP